MWRTAFGHGCHVYGVDVEPTCRAYSGDHVTVFIGDQADPEFWARFVKEVPSIDVVVDDGGHRPYQQIAALKALLPHMNPGGLFICATADTTIHP